MNRVREINCLLLGLVTLAIGVNDANAEIVTSANKDAYIQSGTESATSFGTGPQLLAKNYTTGNSADFDRKTYIGFDTNAFSASNSNWKLTLDVVDSDLGTTPAGTVYNFSVYGLNHSANADGWDQTTITWDSAAGNNTGSGTGFDTDATLLGSFEFMGKGLGASPVMFSSAAFDTFMNGVDDQVTLMIARNTGSADQYVHAFGSSEGQNGARLSAVPEPTSFAMFGLALVGFARRRR